MQQQRRRPPVALSPVNNFNRTTRQSNRIMPSTPSQCFGCSQPMHNSHLSNVLEHLWHPECVRCSVCRCVLNDQCYSREGKLYCKDDFVKKYVHRCFACQNLVQSDELIRRIRPGRIYHSECFVCIKCKKVLQDDDIKALLTTNDTSSLNDLECECQTCLNPDKVPALTNGINGDSEPSKLVNGHVSPPPPPTTKTTVEPPAPVRTTNENDLQQSMEVDEAKSSTSPVKERTPSPVPVPTKATGRQSKVRQSTSSNGKRSPTKAKATTPASRQKQTTAVERKGRSPATRSRASAANSSPAVQTRKSNRRAKKNTRYRKRSYSSGSDEDESDEDDDEEEENDSEFAEEDHLQDEEQENNRSKAEPNLDEKKSEVESVKLPAASQPTPSATSALPQPPPPSTVTNPSLLSQAKMSEPLSLLSGLAANPMSISSIMKPDMTPNFMPAFPTPPQFLPPGFPLQPRLPMPPPPPAQARSAASTTDENRSADASDSDESERSSSPSQMDVSTSVEPGTPARPVPSPKPATATPTTTTQKPSALSSLLEFGTVPPSTLGDKRSLNPTTSANPAAAAAAHPSPFPFPFVTPGPGVAFSPQAAAGMATFYRPPFGLPPTAAGSTMPLDMSQSNMSKPKPDPTENDDKNSQNANDDSSLTSSPKKKARKSNARGKGKGKKNGVEDENGVDEDTTSRTPPPAPATTTSTTKKKKKQKTEATENGNTNDSDETKITNGNHQHNIFAQMGFLNNAFMPPPLPPGAATNGQNPAPNSQQAQLAAMYNMAPHFAAYNAFPGAFNPAFAAAYAASGYPPPFGFHPAFGATPGGQPFPFMQPGSVAPGAPTPNGTDDKSSSDGKPSKSKGKNGGGGEKKKNTTSRTNKKKGANSTASLGDSFAMDGEPSADGIPHIAHTPESSSTPSKRRLSDADSDISDDQQHSQMTNGKSADDSDGSIGDTDRSLSTHPSASSFAAQEKKGARTTIKPQQLEVLCKAYEINSKPNKAEREQIVAETGLSLRVIQVWFQNKRSKERKGKPMKEKESAADDDDIGDDSHLSPPPTTSESAPVDTEA